MRFLLKKYIFIGFFIILIIIGLLLKLSKPPWLSVVNNSVNLQTVNHTNDKTIQYNGKSYHVVKQVKFSKNQYSSPQMNISFIFPDNIQFKQITPQLVALYDPSVKATDENTLYIYSTTVPENSIAFKIPFTIPGNLKQTKIIKTQKYVANQETYSDGKNEITFLILKQKDQTIVFRIPPNPYKVSETITNILSSIKILH